MTPHNQFERAPLQSPRIGFSAALAEGGVPYRRQGVVPVSWAELGRERRRCRIAHPGAGFGLTRAGVVARLTPRQLQAEWWLVDTVAKRQHEEYKAAAYVSDWGSNRLAEK